MKTRNKTSALITKLCLIYLVEFPSHEYFDRLQILQEEVRHSNVTSTDFEQQKQSHSLPVDCELEKKLFLAFLILFIIFFMMLVVVVLCIIWKNIKGRKGR